MFQPIYDDFRNKKLKKEKYLQVAYSENLSKVFFNHHFYFMT